MRVGHFRWAPGAAFALSLLALLVPLQGRATDAPHDVSRLPNQCSDCHVLHNAPGMALTNVAGNFNLCNSCHVANGKPTWAAGDQAIPGTSGSSHSWSAVENNPTYGASEPTTTELLEHSDGFTSNNPNKKVKCSTCHDPHQQTATPFDPAAPSSPTAAGRHFMRINNTANQLCLDCHTARDLTDAGHGTWTGANLSHPVRVANPATADFNTPPGDVGGVAQLAVNVGTATGGSVTALVDTSKAWGSLVGQWIRFTSGSNRNVTRQITSMTGATQVNFATLGAGNAIVAGVTYEIDRDGNLTNNVVLDNAGTPSFTAGNVQCLSCHAVHFADSNSSTYDDQPRAGDGMLLRRTNDDSACSTCHNVQLHNSTTTGSTRAAWGASFTCKTCHKPHSTPNIYLVNQSISTPNSGARAVDFRSMATGIEDQGLTNSAAPGTGPCEVCHTDTRNGGQLTTPGTASFTINNTAVTGVGTTWLTQLAPGWEIKRVVDPPSAWTRIVTVNTNLSLTLAAGGYKGTTGAGSTWQAANPRFRNTGSGRGAAGTEHFAGTCTTCHTHSGGFKGGESNGNGLCSTCHDFDMVIDDAAKTTKYHHVMEVDDKLTAGITTYPTAAAPTVATADQDKSCVQCHADHNIFRPDLNASNSLGRGANLRTRIGNGPPTGAPPAASAPGDGAGTGYYSNRDRDAAFTGGGICLSCHTTAQTKNTTDQKTDTTTGTPALVAADFTASPHAYNVPGRITTGAGTFDVACTKCHNDDATKGYQDGSWKFSLHSSVDRRLRAPLGITVPTDPLDENFCFRCHSRIADVTPGGGPAKSTTLRDYYNVTAMTGQSERVYTVFSDSVAYPFDHPVQNAGAAGRHKPIEGLASGWNPTATRHVECEDCHDPHAAKSPGAYVGTVGSYVAGAAGPPATPDTLTVSGVSPAWAANVWRGYQLRMLSGGQVHVTSPVLGNGANTLSLELATAPAVNDRFTLVATGTSAGNQSPALAGVWGVKPTTWPTQPAPPTWNDSAGAPANPADLTTQHTAVAAWTRTDPNGGMGEVCIKCHSAYAGAVPGAPSGLPLSTKTTWSNTVGGALTQSDLANQFNPNNLAHHAIFARGKNQPIRANYGQAGITSVYNTNATMPWPRYFTGAAGDTLTLANGTATFAGAAALPVTALPGWYVYVGSDTATAGAVAGTATTGYLEITAIASPTSFSVRAENGAGGFTTAITFAATASWYASAGLGNNFVPPYGPWSTLKCSNCHTADGASDPFGPHGSGTKWQLDKAQAQSFLWYNGTQVVTISTVPAAAPSLQQNNLCQNCHRRDVYGDYTFSPTTYAFLARQPHPVDSGAQSLRDAPKWGIVCMNCHGGARTGQIHGSNLGRGNNGAGGSYSGKRLLAGSNWYAVTRSTTAAAGTCWAKGGVDSVDNCAHSHNGVGFNGANNGRATYDYDTNP